MTVGRDPNATKPKRPEKIDDIASMPTSELVHWLWKKWARHGEIEDGVAAARLETLPSWRARAELAESKLPSWVKVGERSPPGRTHVLATFKNGDIEINWFEGGCWWGTDRGDEPTHWMPLPEPPK